MKDSESVRQTVCTSNWIMWRESVVKKTNKMKNMGVIMKRRQSLSGWKMDSICVGGTFHCSSDKERHSSGHRIHQLICIHLHPITSPPSFLSFFYCVRGGSHFFIVTAEWHLSIFNQGLKTASCFNPGTKLRLSYWIILSVSGSPS